MLGLNEAFVKTRRRKTSNRKVIMLTLDRNIPSSLDPAVVAEIRSSGRLIAVNIHSALNPEVPFGRRL